MVYNPSMARCRECRPIQKSFVPPILGGVEKDNILYDIYR